LPRQIGRRGTIAARSIVGDGSRVDRQTETRVDGETRHSAIDPDNARLTRRILSSTNACALKLISREAA
jgi:hypothetical protein